MVCEKCMFFEWLAGGVGAGRSAGQSVGGGLGACGCDCGRMAGAGCVGLCGSGWGVSVGRGVRGAVARAGGVRGWLAGLGRGHSETPRWLVGWRGASGLGRGGVGWGVARPLRGGRATYLTTSLV